MNYYLPHRHHVQVYRNGLGAAFLGGGNTLMLLGLGVAAWLAYREFGQPALRPRAMSRADTAL
jgi:hypothetical protein